MSGATVGAAEPRLSKIIKSALSFWLSETIERVRPHANRMDELRKCTVGDQGDLRIIYHVKANVISLEAFNMAEGTFTELFRERLAPGDISVAQPEI
jgi:hypothetical protein